MSNGPTLRGVNMTNFFKRELFMYALGDIKFKKPISLKKMAYIIAFILIWSLPIILIKGIVMNPFYMILVFGPPFVIGHYATKPVFGGKNLVDFVRTMIKFFSEPKGWADLKNSKNISKQNVYFIESEIWIGRRRELQLLKALKEQRQAEKKAARKARKGRK